MQQVVMVRALTSVHEHLLMSIYFEDGIDGVVVVVVVTVFHAFVFTLETVVSSSELDAATKFYQAIDL